jgi:hypothetical protein
MSQMGQVPIPRHELKRAILLSGKAAWQVGYLADIGASTLSRICSGRREPSPDEVRRLARVLGTDPRDLFPVS